MDGQTKNVSLTVHHSATFALNQYANQKCNVRADSLDCTCQARSKAISTKDTKDTTEKRRKAPTNVRGFRWLAVRHCWQASKQISRYQNTLSDKMHAFTTQALI
jgi:hypothetical protein